MQKPYTIILAPNPSIMTGPGTNTIVLGGGVEGATVIDPALDDVDDAAGRAAILGGGGVGNHRELLKRGEGDVGEERLPAPCVVVRAAVEREGGLAATAAVGDEEEVVHEEVAGSARGPDGGVELREVRNLATEDRRVVYLL